MSENLECYAPNFGQEQGAMSATAELLMYKRERDEARADRDRYRRALASIMHVCGSPTERNPADYHDNVTACYYIARDTIMYYEDRLPAAGGAE